MMNWLYLTLYSLLFHFNRANHLNFKNRINTLRILSWKRAFESTQVCLTSGEKIEEKCEAGGIEHLEQIKDQLIGDSAQWTLVKITGSILFQKYHGRIEIQLSNFKIVAQMLFGVPKGPIAVFKKQHLHKVLDENGAAWTFDHRVVEIASFVEKQEEVTIIIDESGGNVIYGKKNGTKYSEASLENVEVSHRRVETSEFGWLLVNP